MSSDRSALFAFLLGGVIGAGIALMYAPEAGSETRKRLRRNAEDAEDWAKDSFRETIDDAKERLVEGKEAARQLITTGKEDLQDALQTGVEAFQREKARLKEIF